MDTLLVVEDDMKLAEGIVQYFQTKEFSVHHLSQAERTDQIVLDLKPDLVLLDLRFSEIQGLDVLKDLKTNHPELPVVIMTGHSTTDTVIESMKRGAENYIAKPFQLEKLEEMIREVLHRKNRHQSLRVPTVRSIDTDDTKWEIIGHSSEMVEIAKLIGQVAGTDAPVLITGESGTGKELVARGIHANSLRKNQPFLSINCAALPETLLESELFGYDKGAFTGAYARKLGKFEQSNGGTIFLDEIADMSLLTQSKVLRVLQEQEFERVGGNQTIKVDVRIIAATNKSLVQCIKTNVFRVDLFYRLKVVSVHLPPLRERRSDIPLLVNHFIRRYSQKAGKPMKGISREALQFLKEYPWPGNVRELENNVHTAVVMSKEDVLLPENFPAFSENSEKISIDFQKVKEDYSRIFTEVLDSLSHQLFCASSGKVYDHLIWALEKSLITLALKYTEDNQVKSAKLLGISRNTLRDRMSKYDLL
jgi:two-component system, NtrC family, nitrogen regulation response regulator GlnG